MKEEIIVLDGSRLVTAGWREVEPREIDPDKIRLGSLETRNGEQLVNWIGNIVAERASNRPSLGIDP